MTSTNSSPVGSILDQNCRAEWQLWICSLCNVAGLISTGIWFIVLFPQLIHNCRRKSVHGLSLSWATANFTASFVNLFFVFSLAEMPLYAKISAVYMPTLEMAILLQFLYYETEISTRFKTIYSCLGLLAWVTILLLQVFFHISDKLVWIAIALWSVETIPQLFLNYRLDTTSGQAVHTVLLALAGKMTDFIANNGLVMPLQYVIMVYFSCSTAYLNGLQVVYYNWTASNGRADQPCVAEESHDRVTTPRDRSECCFSVRCLSVIYLLAAIVLFIVGLVWNTRSYWSIFAPFGLFLVIGVGFFVIRKQKSKHLVVQSGSPSKPLFTD